MKNFFLGWEQCLTGIASKHDPNRPQRMTDEQLRYYSKDSGYYIRSLSTAGVELHVRTDALVFVMEVEIEEGSSQDIWGFDLLLENHLFAHIDGRTSIENRVKWCVELGSGMKKITLCFPCLARVTLTKLMMEGATVSMPDPPVEIALCCGDSIAQGYTSRFPSLTWPSILARGLGLQLLNQSVAGMTFESDMPVMRTSAKKVFIAYGTNDWTCKDKTHYERDACETIGHIKEAHPRAHIIVMAPIWRPDINSIHSYFDFEDLRPMFDCIAKTMDTDVIFGEQLYPCVSTLFHDNVHPNEQGHMIYGARILSIMRDIISRRK